MSAETVAPADINELGATHYPTIVSDRDAGEAILVPPARRPYRRSATPKETKSPKRMPSALAGRAGMSLVEFQLGRRGFEFLRTPPESKSGDLWAETGVGRVSIEVKSTVRGNSWFVKSSQTGSEFYCLTNLDEALCYVVTRREMDIAITQSPLTYPGVYSVHFRSLPADSLEGWFRLGGERKRAIEKEAKRATYKSTRVVKQKMADGTIKTYVYPATSRR